MTHTSAIPGRHIKRITRTGTIVYGAVTNEFGNVVGHELSTNTPLLPFERQRRVFTCSCGGFTIKDYDATVKRAFIIHKAATA